MIHKIYWTVGCAHCDRANTVQVKFNTNWLDISCNTWPSTTQRFKCTSCNKYFWHWTSYYLSHEQEYEHSTKTKKG